MNRRKFLQIAGVGGGAALSGCTLKAGASDKPSEFVGMLVDTTRCIGCRSCEVACAEANGLPEPDFSTDVFEKERKTDTNHWIVINRYETEKGTVFARRACMHCNQAACASACLVKAMLKTKEGPVIWRNSKCMGCRYCMISCPFDIPKFEYNSYNPRIRKCIFCYERLKKGQKPACVEACPADALKFGRRRDLVEEAKMRIYQNSDKYVHYIYGEHEVGGTGLLYLSSVPFEQIGFRTDLGTTAYPELTTGFLYGVAMVFILWPAFLLGVNYISKRREENER